MPVRVSYTLGPWVLGVYVPRGTVALETNLRDIRIADSGRRGGARLCGRAGLRGRCAPRSRFAQMGIPPPYPPPSDGVGGAPGFVQVSRVLPLPGQVAGVVRRAAAWAAEMAYVERGSGWRSRRSRRERPRA